MPLKEATTRRTAFVVLMIALANVLGYFSIPLGITKIHFMQLPIIFSALALGSVAGGVVGFTGAAVMAFTLPTPNPYILPGNAILGFFTGLFYLGLKRIKPPIVPQLLSVIGAMIVQFPYTYVSDVYLMAIPAPSVFYAILPLLLIEDIICLFIAHAVLFRVNLANLLRK